MRNIREVILFLNTIRFNNKRIIELIDNGSISSFIGIDIDTIQYINNITVKEKEYIKDNIKNFNISLILDNLYKYNINYSCIIDINYPKKLKNIYNAPAILYYKGNGFDDLDNTLAIVGTRKPTEYGIWVVKKIISQLKSYNIKIVSGMAIGIDYSAHNESISNNIRTIGVLASSLEYTYPISNLSLYKKMKNELLISEFPLSTPPIKRNFVQRNRIISGLCFGVLVIQASEKSGSLITANFALEQNREIYAIPGDINSVYSIGCNNLIKKGAKIVQDAKDIIEELNFLLETNKVINYNKQNYNINTLKVIKLLKRELLTIDEIVDKVDLDIQEIYSIIVKLELDNIVMNIGNKYTILY